jgi:hypothetical protein
VRLPYLIWPEVGRKGVVDGGAARVFTGGDGGMAFCWLGCRRAVKKLLGSFYRLMWCCWCAWPGLRGGVSMGRRRGRAAARFELTGTAGDDVWGRENEIGLAGEHQWVAAVL